jgi:hypothetical protein
MDEEDLLYENDFDIYELAKSPSSARFKYTDTPSTEVARGLDFGESIYDKAFLPSTTVNDDGNIQESINENRAYRQPWVAKTGAGIGRIAGKVVAEISKMPGVLGGVAVGAVGQLQDWATGEDNTDFMKTAFDNPWINTIKNAEDALKKEALPVYVKKAISEGSLVDNIFSMDFWATEGADGLGYIISMLAPGALINKFNVGTKLLSPFAKATSKVLGSTEKAAGVLTKAGITAENANIWTATVANTLFEAAAESKGAMDTFKNGKVYQDLQKNKEARTGAILQELLADYAKNGYTPKETVDAEGNVISTEIPTHGEIIAELQQKAAQLAEKEIQDAVGKVGANVFGANAAILYLPNLMVSKMLWANPISKGALGYKKGAFETLKQLTNKQSIGYGAKEFAIAGAREGLWEEGMQSTAEEYFTKNPDASIIDGIGDLPKAYADMISDVPGQKAIFLGAFFGGGMQAYHGTVNEKSRRTKANQLISGANKVLESLDNFMFSDNFLNASGEIEVDNKTGAVRKDYAKVIQKLEGLQSVEDYAKVFDEAVQAKDEATIAVIKEVFTTNLIKPFLVNPELGIEALRQHLEASDKILEQDKSEKFNRKNYIDGIMKKAKKLQSEYNTYSKFGELFFDIKNDEATQADKQHFYNRTAMQYINNKSLQALVESQIAELDGLMNDIMEPLQNSLEAVSKSPEDFETLKEQKGVNKLIAPLEKKRKDLKDIERGLNEKVLSLWDNDNINKEFEKDFKVTKARRELENQVKEVDGILKQIENATTPKELDKIDIPENSIAKTELLKAKDKKSKELVSNSKEKSKSKKETAKEKKEAADKLTTERAEAVEEVKSKFNEGEKISLPTNVESKLAESTKSSNGTYTYIGINKNNGIILENDKGKQFPISPITMRDSASTTIATTDIDGGITPGQEDNRDEKGIDPLNNLKTAKVTNDARLVVTNNNKGFKNEVLPFTTEAVFAYERTPKDKKGYYNIKVNESVRNLNSTWDNAVQAFIDKDYSKLEDLINHLPISVVIEEGVIEIPLETLTEGDTTVFEETSKKLRTVIVKELAQGTSIENIQVELAGQWKGDLQIDGNNENNVAQLYDFKGDVKNIKLEDIYYVDHHQNLVNNKGKLYPGGQSRPLAPGEIYIKITTANGDMFPLKLNVAKVNKKEASLIYELIKYRFENRFDEKGNVKKDDTSNVTPIGQIPGIVEDLRDNFPEVVELFNKEKIVIEDMFLKDLLRFFVHDSNNPSFGFRFSKDNFIVGGVKFTREEFMDDKDGFVDTMVNDKVNYKRRNIKTKRAAQDNNNLNLSRRNYMEYLVNNKILNTNAVVNEPTFQGQTTMYVRTNSVKANGKESNFNEEVKKTYFDKLIGTESSLKKLVPGLFTRGKLDKVQTNVEGERTYYVDPDTKEEFERVSSLKKQPKPTMSLYTGSKRGDIMDDLTRYFFSEAQISKEEFLEKANEVINYVNNLKNKSGTELEFTPEVLEELYDILEEYKEIFSENKWTIFADTNPLYGVIGSKGNIAGAMDLLAYDNTNKKFIIIDLKTSSMDRADIYNQKSPAFPYKENDKLQQNAYRELFKQRTKLEADMLILPIEIKAEDNIEYSNLPIRTSAKKKFLSVEKESIYKILKISSSTKKETTKTTKKNTKDKIKEAKENNKDTGVLTIDREQYMTQFHAEQDYVQVVYEGETYVVTGGKYNKAGSPIGGFYVGIAPSEYAGLGAPLEDVDLILKIIDLTIKEKPTDKKFTKENAREIWNSRKNFVSSQDNTKKKITTKKKTKKDNKSNDAIRDSFAQMNESELSSALNELFKLGSEVNSGFLIELNPLMAEVEDETDGKGTNLDKFLKVYDYLVEYGVDKETIEERCN